MSELATAVSPDTVGGLPVHNVDAGASLIDGAEGRRLGLRLSSKEKGLILRFLRMKAYRTHA
jgi:hypothetical protein